MRQLTAAAFDRRLDPTLDQPIAVAVSGGGDSTFALAATVDWAQAHGRRVVAIGVDHGLQAASGAWLDVAEATASGLGAAFVRLAWAGEKPRAGLAAEARRARHALIAEAARAAGASVVVFGHTADDRAEAGLMRAWGLRIGDPYEWAPAPVWPEGRGVFAFRPLLDVRRSAIRDALVARGLAWIDDPANEDLDQPRARARRALVDRPAPPPPAASCSADAARAAHSAAVEAGVIRIPGAALDSAGSAAARLALAAGLICAGGGERPPRGERLASLMARVAAGAAFTATLAGAKLIAGGDLVIVRDAGETARGGLATKALEPSAPTVWDGRFAIATTRVGLLVAPLKGLARRLPVDQQRALAALPAPGRPALPVVLSPDGAATCPILAREPGIEVHDLVPGRFLAACGAVSKEPRA